MSSELGKIWPPERVVGVFNQREKLEEIASTGDPKERALARLKLNGGIGVEAILNGASLTEVKAAKKDGEEFRRVRDELKKVFSNLPWD